MTDKEIPNGWKLVPSEPTQDMLAVVHVRLNTSRPEDALRRRWRMMLAAAPAPPDGANELKEQEVAVLREIADRPIPYTAWERLDRWWNGPRHRDHRADRPRRI